MAYDGSRTRLRLLVAVLVLAAVLVAPRAALAGRGGTPSIAWSPCNGQFECATVDVPLDYDRPRGPSVELALRRLPAADPSRRIGSLFLNPGGPGRSGVGFVLTDGPTLFTEEVRARYDLVGFDPRGIVHSTPARCFDSAEQWNPPFEVPFVFPQTREEERLRVAADHYIVDACDRRAGPIIEHMSTANVARDLDVLRERVGDRELHYVGYSYGSYLGITYAALFPDRVGALVIDGVLDPVAWSSGQGREGSFLPVSTRLRSHRSAQATLEEFFRLCDAAGPRCAFSGAAAERFAALADRVRRDPIDVVDPAGTIVFSIDYTGFIQITLRAMYDSAEWEFFAKELAGWERASVPVPLSARLDPSERRLPYVAPEEPDYVNEVEGYPAVECSDSINPGDYGAWSSAGARADRSGYFGRLWTWESSLCADWRWSDEDRYLGPFDRATANPVLVVGNRFDPSTRYEGAVAAADLLPRSALLTVNGWGHLAAGRSSCADEAVGRYLLDGVTPAPGTECEQDVPPFGKPPGAR